MFVGQHYASGTARLRLLYSLPLQGGERRVLLRGYEQDTHIAPIEIGEGLQFWSPGTLRPAEQLEAILLPNAFDTNKESPERLLAVAAAGLAPGGVLVGHTRQAAYLPGLRSPNAIVTLWRQRRVCNAQRLQRTLIQLGLCGARSFTVSPHIFSPMVLVPSDADAARAYFVDEALRNRPLYGRAGTLLRMATAKMGAGPLQQGHLFFWGCKPC